MQSKTIQKIINRLDKLYGIEVHRSNPFKTLIGVILSHRTKDDVSWPAARRLFDVADSPEKILKLPEKKIAKIIYPVGFYNQKAKRIKQVCKMVLEEFDGKVPKTREELMKLPGVGGKSSDIVLSYAYGVPVIACDAHVIWVSNQLEWTNSKNPEKVRQDLHKTVPIKYRLSLNSVFVEFGKEICITGKPKCIICPIKKYCPSSRLKTK